MVSPSFFWHNKKTVWEGIYILTAYSIIKNCDVLMVMCPGMSVYICVFVCLQMKEKWNLEKQMQGTGWSF